MHSSEHSSGEAAQPPRSSGEGPPPFHLTAWTPALRLLATAALVVAGANILYLLARFILLDVLQGDQATPPPFILRQLALLSLLPWGLTWLLRRLLSATLQLEPQRLVLKLRHAWFEIPYASVAGVQAWRLPLPGGGLVLRLQSGRRFRYRLEPQAPVPLLEALSRVLPMAEPALRHPALLYSQARLESARHRRRHLLIKLLLFPLLPTAILFRAHQLITYGGPLGEYHLLGLDSYLKTLAGYWVGVLAMLLLYAGFWRAVAELFALGATSVLPSRARGLRRLAEGLCLLVYYVGVPALVLVRFLL